MIFLLVLIFAIPMECLLSGPLLAYLNTEIVQGIVNHESVSFFIYPLFGTFTLIAFCNSLQTVNLTYYKRHLTLRMQDKILKHVYNLKDYSAWKAGEIFAHVDQNVEAYCSEKVEICTKFTKAVCLSVFSGIYIFNLSFSLMAFTYLLAGGMIALNYLTAVHIGVTSKALNEKNNELVKYRWEMIGNSEIAAALVDEKVLKKYLETNQEIYQLSVALSRKKLFSSMTKRYGYLVILTSVSIFGGLLALRRIFTLSELFGIIVLLPRLTGALLDLPKVLTDYSSNKGLKTSIETIFSQNQYIADGKTELREKISDIVCSDIVFSYAGNPVLRRFTFQFHQDSVYLITGTSGSGKSTLLRLLCRSLTPESGVIKINSILLHDISRESLWKRVFYAPQNSVIFPTTLGKNIACNQEEDLERIHRCMREVNLHNFRIDLDERVDIESLSAGERQKIVFARALYRRDAVLILDEPTSAMDPASEEICFASLYQKAHKEHLIVILVSHNLSCKKFADVLCNMVDGELKGVLG